MKEGKTVNENLKTFLDKSTKFLSKKCDSFEYGIYLIPSSEPTEESKTKLQS